MKFQFFTSVITLFLAAGALAQEIEFKAGGKTVRKLSLEELTKQFPAEKVTVFEDRAQKERSYQAIPFGPVLKAIYGNTVKSYDEMLFTCLDGYQPSIGLVKVLNHKNWLALSHEDKSPFQFHEARTQKDVPLGPFYLIWENLQDKVIRSEGDEDWPYQLTTVDLVKFSQRFGAISPPDGSSPAVQRGFAAYRKQCFQCHTINGEGGAKGIELNYPVNVTEYFKESFLKKWMSDPQSIRFNATMPQVNPTYPHRVQMIDDIYLYLKAMAKRKQAPKLPQ